MTRRRRRLLVTASVCAAGLLACAAALLVVLQSDWFFGLVRDKLVATIETATGGRVEIGSFHFYWKELRAEVRGLVVHGTEPAVKPPLLRAERVEVGLRILSLVHRDVNIASLAVTRPQVYLIVAPDGRTNLPEPKVRRQGGPGAMDTILDLAIGRFSLDQGAVEVEARGRAPLDASGENLRLRFQYAAAPARYQGEVAMSPLRLNLPDAAPLQLGVDVQLSVERNRVQLADARFTSGASQATVRGTLDDFAAPHGTFHYQARADLAEVVRALKSRVRLTGAALVEGDGVYRGGSDVSAVGSLHAYGIEFRDDSMRIRNARADGKLEAAPGRVTLTGLRISATYSDGPMEAPAGVEIHSLTWTGGDLEAKGIAAAALGGTFRGEGELRGFRRYNVRGELAGFEIRRLVAIYSREPLPWDGRLSGTARVEGDLKDRGSAAADARIDIAPAAEGVPVTGQAQVHYDARRGVLDLGRSHVELPHTRARASGAVGSRLAVHLETSDLNDLLPALGAAKVPLKIESGAVIFDGAVTGKLDAPHVAGKLTTGRIAYEGAAIDSLAADVTAAPDRVSARNVLLARGTLRGRGAASIGLTHWKPEETGALEANVDLQNAALADLLAMADRKAVDLTGSLNATAQVGGTIGKPTAKAEIAVVKGSALGEPFDRFTAQAAYADRVLTVAQAQVAAGTRQIELSGSYALAATSPASGKLQFKLSTNAMALDEFRLLEQARPGIQGTLTANAAGTLDVLAPPGRDRIRIAALQADVRGRDLRMTGQPLGDLRLTATSEGKILRARLASDFANSRIRGDGQWTLADDYPGSATITFTRLDFQQLRAWISPKQSPGQFDLAGAAEGELKIEGPASKPDAWKATLRIPKVEVGPAPHTALANSRTPLALRNEGPVVASMANQVVTVESARLVGRSTDLSLTGKATLLPRRSLDLRVNGRLDLTILHDFSTDVISSGLVLADANIRGPLQAPQLNGRLELKDAAFNLLDFPNGLSRANGVILFTGDRATIQSLSGETGGGKVTLSGFAGYGAGDPVFRIDASAHQVRVRYPEGVSTVADAELNLTGTLSRSMLTGTVTILRTGFNPQSDLSSILAASAEPVRTASARTGFLGGLNFDIQIETSPDLTVQSSLAEGVQVEANLRLRGTASNPAVLGRVNVTQGQIVFFGTRYSINQGSVSFYNPVRVEPVLNIDLETRARGIDVTLTVSGPLNKLQLTPRSDPPLQFSEIVALLATGRAPTSDPTALTQQNTGPQSWQQMGASALLGQAIANPVAGRLQRFFGVSKLKIDPSLTGVENNPQARLTLEQQVTQNITFTYITNVTSSNPQVVRVEWAFTPRWSAVAVREENGLFGLDFLYKRRFK